MSKLPIFEHFLSVGNLKPKLKWFFKPKLKPNFFLLNWAPGSEVHGVAILLDKEAEAKMDRQEGAGFVYRKESVELEAYDGRKLQGRNREITQNVPHLLSSTHRFTGWEQCQKYYMRNAWF